MQQKNVPWEGQTFNSRDKLFKVVTPDYYRVKSVPVSSAVLISVIITCVTCYNPNTVLCSAAGNLSIFHVVEGINY